MIAAKAIFDGETYQANLDFDRLNTLQQKVEKLMLDGEWRTFGEIKQITGGSEASISARIRDLRKIKHGNYIVWRRRRGDEKTGLHEYKIAGKNIAGDSNTQV